LGSGIICGQRVQPVGYGLRVNQALCAIYSAFVLGLSELLESFGVARARRAIQSLLKLVPQTALLKDGDRFAEVPVEEVHIGDIIAVKSGACVPLDGAIVNGNSSVDQAR